MKANESIPQGTIRRFETIRCLLGHGGQLSPTELGEVLEVRMDCERLDPHEGSQDEPREGIEARLWACQDRAWGLAAYRYAEQISLHPGDLRSHHRVELDADRDRRRSPQIRSSPGSSGCRSLRRT